MPRSCCIYLKWGKATEKTITSILGDDFGWFFQAILVAPFFCARDYAGICRSQLWGKDLSYAEYTEYPLESKHGHIKFNHTIYLYI